MSLLAVELKASVTSLLNEKTKLAVPLDVIRLINISICRRNVKSHFVELLKSELLFNKPVLSWLLCFNLLVAAFDNCYFQSMSSNVTKNVVATVPWPSVTLPTTTLSLKTTQTTKRWYKRWSRRSLRWEVGSWCSSPSCWCCHQCQDH